MLLSDVLLNWTRFVTIIQIFLWRRITGFVDIFFVRQLLYHREISAGSTELKFS